MAAQKLRERRSEINKITTEGTCTLVMINVNYWAHVCCREEVYWYNRCVLSPQIRTGSNTPVESTPVHFLSTSVNSVIDFYHHQCTCTFCSLSLCRYADYFLYSVFINFWTATWPVEGRKSVFLIQTSLLDINTMSLWTKLIRYNDIASKFRW